MSIRPESVQKGEEVFVAIADQSKFGGYKDASFFGPCRVTEAAPHRVIAGGYDPLGWCDTWQTFRRVTADGQKVAFVCDPNDLELEKAIENGGDERQRLALRHLRGALVQNQM